MIIETPTWEAIDAVAKDAAGHEAWAAFREQERDKWRAASAVFLIDYGLTPEKAISDADQALYDEGWRWGWERNLQLKTDPRLNIHAPEATPYHHMLRRAHAAAHARID